MRNTRLNSTNIPRHWLQIEEPQTQTYADNNDMDDKTEEEKMYGKHCDNNMADGTIEKQTQT